MFPSTLTMFELCFCHDSANMKKKMKDICEGYLTSLVLSALYES